MEYHLSNLKAFLTNYWQSSGKTFGAMLTFEFPFVTIACAGQVCKTTNLPIDSTEDYSSSFSKR